MAFSTFSTVSFSVGANIKIGFGEGVTILAVRNSGSKHVFVLRYSLQMVWVYAALILAQMIDLKSFGNLSFVQCITKSMGELSILSRNVNLTVAVCDSSGPLPTCMQRNHFYFSPKPIGYSSHIGTIPRWNI